MCKEFHLDAIEQHTDFRAFTPDCWYKGSARIDIKLLLEWIKDNDAVIPPKRLLFLQRLARMQHAQSTSPVLV